MRSKIIRRSGLILLLLSCWFSAVHSYAAEVHNVRVWIAPDHARLVFDLSAAVQHKLFTLKKPDRIVLDVADATLISDLQAVDLSGSPVSLMRSGSRNGGKDLRIVLDLKEHVKPKSFVLKPNDQYGNRLVVDLYRDVVSEEPQKTAVASANDPATLRDIVIAIDAGHGGEDPGAIGPGRVKEKTVPAISYCAIIRARAFTLPFTKSILSASVGSRPAHRPAAG